MKLTMKKWGTELIIADTPEYRGKILTINPGKSIHLQYHEKKDETMYILEGMGYIALMDKTYGTFVRANPGETYHIKPKTEHKVWAIKNSKLKIFEVSNGVQDSDIHHLEAE